MFFCILVVVTMSRTGAREAAGADSTPFRAYGTWNGMSLVSTLIRRYQSDGRSRSVDFMPLDSNPIIGSLMRTNATWA